MLAPIYNEESAAAVAEAARAWSNVFTAWSAFAAPGSDKPPLERYADVWKAGAEAQQATLRAMMMTSSARYEEIPFGITGLFHAAPPAPPAAYSTPKAQRAKTAKPASPKATGGGFQSLAKPLGRADDLTAVKGIGPKMAEKLNALGVFHYWQLASMTPADVATIEAELPAQGRVARDDWIAQARRLAEEVEA